MTYESYPQYPQVPVDNWPVFEVGGGGAGQVVIIVGAAAPHKKAKLEKGRNHHYPNLKKRGLLDAGSPEY